MYFVIFCPGGRVFDISQGDILLAYAHYYNTYDLIGPVHVLLDVPYEFLIVFYYEYPLMETVYAY